MKKNFKVCNSTFNINDYKEIEEIMDIIRNDDEHFFAETKETFTHKDDDLNFNYKYAVVADVCEGGTFYGIYLIPIPNSLSKKKRKSVMQCCGADDNDLCLMDVFDYGLSVKMADDANKEEEDIETEILTNMANTISFFDRMRGFYLDKSQNLIGTRGWDILENAINDVKLF